MVRKRSSEREPGRYRAILRDGPEESDPFVEQPFASEPRRTRRMSGVAPRGSTPLSGPPISASSVAPPRSSPPEPPLVTVTESEPPREPRDDVNLNPLLDELVAVTPVGEPQPVVDTWSTENVSRDDFFKLAAGAPREQLPVLGCFGAYEVFGRLAFGGMAEILLARVLHNGVARNVVLKRLRANVAGDKSFVDMFLDEARFGVRLTHPNICHVYEFGKRDDQCFIAMEWVHGITLSELRQELHARNERIPVPMAVRTIAAVADALHYAHRARGEDGQLLGIVHRDVTPQNIMIGFDGNVKLLDFGIAKAEARETKTQSGVVKGKLAYMAPEQVRCLELDGRADVFSLGVCLYEALTGARLYRRANEYETITAVLETPVPSVRDVDPSLPEALDVIVSKALAKDRSERYATAGEMQRALEQWLVDERHIVPSAKIAGWLARECGNVALAGPQVEVEVQGLTPIASEAAPIVQAPIVVAAPPVRRRFHVLAGAALAIVAVLAAGLTITFVPHEASVPHERMTNETTPTTPREPVDTSVPPAPHASAGATLLAAGGQHSSSTSPTPMGYLSINTHPWSRVYLPGGRFIGTTPIGEARVPAGSLRLRLVDRDGVAHYKIVHVAPNRREHLSVDFR